MTNGWRGAARYTLWSEQGGRCHYCHIEVIPVEAGTLDHIVPRGFGGPREQWNLVYACDQCNNDLRDSVRKCDCQKCVRALDRFHKTKGKHARRENVIRSTVTLVRPRPLVEVLEEIERRNESVRRKLGTVDPHSHEGAALRGKATAYREALELITAIDLIEEPPTEATG